MAAGIIVRDPSTHSVSHSSQRSAPIILVAPATFYTGWRLRSGSREQTELTSASALPPLLTCVYQDFPWVSSKQSSLQRAVSHHLLALYSPWQHLRANIWLEISFTLPGDLNLNVLAEMAQPAPSFESWNWAKTSKQRRPSPRHMLLCDCPDSFP